MTRRGTPEADLQRAVVRALRVALPRTAIIHHCAIEVTEAVRRWIDDLGLTAHRIIEVASETRRDHHNPPDGPKALDRFMERAAQRDAKDTAASCRARKAKRSRKAQGTPSPSPDELAAFYAAKVNSDAYLPPNMISNAMCEAMLARRLVTADRLRQRGVR